MWIDNRHDHADLLREYVEKNFPAADIDVDWEYSGIGNYEFSIRTDRPERRPLVSLKWRGL